MQQRTRSSCHSVHGDGCYLQFPPGVLASLRGVVAPTFQDERDQTTSSSNGTESPLPHNFTMLETPMRVTADGVRLAADNMMILAGGPI